MEVPAKTRIVLGLAVALAVGGTVAFRSSAQPEVQDEPEVAAAAPAPILKPAPSTPISEEKAILGDDHTWRPEWDATIEKALPPELLSAEVSRDVHQFCPRFSQMGEADKRAYWAYFFQALAGAEAGLESTSDVQHTEPQVAVVDHVSHRMVRAQGLLQLTYEDAERYGCDFDWDHDKHLRPHDPDKTILQPENNLLCGVKILKTQLIDKHQPLLSKNSYWSTLRPSWPGNRVFLKQMSNVPEACGRRRTRQPAIVHPSSDERASVSLPETR